MKTARRNPWLYVPSLYFTEGLPYILVNTVSVIMYKKMGLSNEFIGLTSILYLPWVIKMFWSPVVDVYKTKRTWITASQLMLCFLFVCIACAVPASLFVPLSRAALTAAAFASATNDIATDGYYMLALDKVQQAFFLGVRSTCYRLAMIFGSGLLVVLAGFIENRSGSIALSWSAVMAIAAALFLSAFFFHRQ